MSEVTRILSQIEQGEPSAAERLLPLVYDELRRLAAAQMSNEKPGQTIQATALVHDAFIRLVEQKIANKWDNSRHFFSAAAEAMRRILIERARQRSTLKRGGDRDRIELGCVDPAVLPLARIEHKPSHFLQLRWKSRAPLLPELWSVQQRT